MKKIKKFTNKKMILIILILSVAIITTIFTINIFKNNYKKIKLGNNTNTEMIKDIYNLESYKAKVKIRVTSNKNENEYEAYQETKGEIYNKQEMLKPDEINGMEIIYENGNLEIKNTNLDLIKIYKNYKDLQSNDLFLNTFIKDYKENKENNVIEKDEKIIITEHNNKNKYSTKKQLKLDKKTGKPEELTIYDYNNKVKIYILYIEIELNN